MKPETPNAGEPVSVYLDAALAERLRKAEKDLKGKGYSRSEILSEAIAEGLPLVIAKLRRRKAKFSFTDAVVQVIDSFPLDVQFTRDDVIALLKARFEPAVKKYKARDLASNTLTVLRRLTDRGKVKLVGTREANGPKALRSYEVNCYSRIEPEKETS